MERQVKLSTAAAAGARAAPYRPRRHARLPAGTAASGPAAELLTHRLGGALVLALAAAAMAPTTTVVQAQQPEAGAAPVAQVATGDLPGVDPSLQNAGHDPLVAGFIVLEGPIPLVSDLTGRQITQSQLMQDSLSWQCTVCSESIQDGGPGSSGVAGLLDGGPYAGADNEIRITQIQDAPNPPPLPFVIDAVEGLLPGDANQDLVVTAEQYGDENLIDLTQQGSNLRAHIIQDGVGNRAVWTQRLYGSTLYIRQNGLRNDIEGELASVGEGNVVEIAQSGEAGLIDLGQLRLDGSDNRVRLAQSGNEDHAGLNNQILLGTVVLLGDANQLHLSQAGQDNIIRLDDLTLTGHLTVLQDGLGNVVDGAGAVGQLLIAQVGDLNRVLLPEGDTPFIGSITQIGDGLNVSVTRLVH